jgi:hypothetical protein
MGGGAGCTVAAAVAWKRKRSFFEKSSAKTFLSPGDGETSRVKVTKVFWLFFSKKNFSLESCIALGAFADGYPKLSGCAAADYSAGLSGA